MDFRAIMDNILKTLFCSEDEERYILGRLAYFMVFMAVATYFILLFETISYGRYASSRYGFPVNAKVAWFIQELPALLLPLSLILWAPSSKLVHLPNQLLLGMYFCHYFQRSLIYPFLIEGGKPTPFVTFVLAFLFCIYNGYMQVRYLSHYAEFPKDWVTSPNFISGSCLWLIGWIININSDHILRNLRRPGQTGYKIPRGGLFKYVSGANFFGEIVEWAGFALASYSLQSFAFALHTAVVLSSRAIAHHRWYRGKFKNYPNTRRALIPYVF